VQDCRGSHTAPLWQGSERTRQRVLYVSGTSSFASRKELEGCVLRGVCLVCDAPKSPGTTKAPKHPALFGHRRNQGSSCPHPRRREIVSTPAFLSIPRNGEMYETASSLNNGGTHGQKRCQEKPRRHRSMPRHHESIPRRLAAGGRMLRQRNSASTSKNPVQYKGHDAVTVNARSKLLILDPIRFQRTHHQSK